MATGENKESKKEREQLIKTKIGLATELGIWGGFKPIQGYQETEQYKKIQEINKRLLEIQ